VGLEDHPGYFGITSQGTILIHADWPVYPEEHGADLALLWLTAFPPGTAFKKVDDIDLCWLFLADLPGSPRSAPRSRHNVPRGRRRKKAKTFDERNFHIAIWHEDLVDLHKRGLINGLLTEGEALKLYWSKLPADLKELNPTPSDQDFEDTTISKSFSDAGVTVSLAGAGRYYAASLLVDVAVFDLSPFGDRVLRLFELGYYDTAVREACVRLEVQIKTAIGSRNWGDPLANEFISNLRRRGIFIESFLRVLRAQIRTAFKLIRNDFMHNFVDMDEIECRAILFRLSRVKRKIDVVLRGQS
jgi:hypothetical protein